MHLVTPCSAARLLEVGKAIMLRQILHEPSVLPVVMICFLGLLFLTSICTATEIIAIGRPSGGAILGKGYSTKSQDFRGDCLVYTRENLLRVGSPEGTILFTRTLSSSELQNSLGFAAGTRARFGLTQVSAAADFAREATSNEYSETTTYAATYYFKNAYAFQPTLSNFAKELRGTDLFVSTNFIEACGDEFVEQIKLGAKLLINARIEFAQPG